MTNSCISFSLPPECWFIYQSFCWLYRPYPSGPGEVYFMAGEIKSTTFGCFVRPSSLVEWMARQFRRSSGPHISSQNSHAVRRMLFIQEDRSQRWCLLLEGHSLWSHWHTCSHTLADARLRPWSLGGGMSGAQCHPGRTRGASSLACPLIPYIGEYSSEVAPYPGFGAVTFNDCAQTYKTW